MNIRPATADDALAILTVHYDAVHNVAAGDYSDDILQNWSPPVDALRVVSFLENPDNEQRIVAELEGSIVGFGCLVPAQNELRACYVRSHVNRKGVGRSIVAHLESMAADQGLDFLQLSSSLTAEGFYKALGYEETGRDVHAMRGGMMMDCVRMEKKL